MHDLLYWKQKRKPVGTLCFYPPGHHNSLLFCWLYIVSDQLVMEASQKPIHSADLVRFDAMQRTTIVPIGVQILHCQVWGPSCTC